MKNYLRNGQCKRVLTCILVIAMIFTSVNYVQFIPVQAATDEVTLYFVDNTAKQWVKNDNAKMQAVDNSNGHDYYWMTQIDDTTWSVKVPKSAYNMTFNRYSSDETTQWNSWSAGGRDENNAYYADGSEYGHWEVKEETGFQEGDVIYLDLTEFTDWEKDNASMYVNFTSATNNENNGENISIADADKKVYNPKKVESVVAEHIYGYAVTKEDEGATELRFWRGNDTNLWNCSINLSYNEFLNGMNCVKVTGWEQGYLDSYEMDPNILFDTSKLQYSEELEAWVCNDKLDLLYGTVTSTESINGMEYTVCDLKDNILLNGVVDASIEWKINNFGLSYGYNNVTVKAIMKSGREYKNTLTIWNTSSENLNNLSIDTSDTDEDGLDNYMELVHETNPEKSDTDGDGLSDAYELYVLNTDPLLTDTDGNGIRDSEEDADGDNLSNGYEFNLGTSPQHIDTDTDGLTDEEEVNKYETDPLKIDTDDDTLSDKSETTLGFDPNKQDTDNDSILDCDELIFQEYEYEETDNVIKNIKVTLECTGDLSEQIDVCKTDEHAVVGGIGSAYDISVDADFDMATVTFSYDESILGDTKEENLCVLWYDEENDIYDILDDTTVVNTENNTVSYTTTHFSDYLLVDKEIWYDVWRENQNYRSSKEPIYYNVALAVDVSGSMSGNNMIMAKKTLHAFVDALMSRDNACLISYNSYASLCCDFCTGENTEALKTSIDRLYAYGGTDISSGINLACIKLLDSSYGINNQDIIVLICDGQSTCSDTVLDGAIRNNIKINCINVANGSATELKRIAEATGGEYYYAATSDELTEVMKQLEKDTLGEIDVTDSDGDGLYDVYEVNGMKIATGDIIYTDPNNADSDGDGTTDGEEMGGLSTEKYEMEGVTYSCTLFHNTSNPNKKGTELPTGWKYVDDLNYLPLSTQLYNRMYIEPVDYRYYKYDNNQIIYGYENIHGVGKKYLTETLKEELSNSYKWWNRAAIVCGGTNAGKFLQYYLSNKGGSNQYDATSIISKGSIGENYNKNVTAMIKQSKKLVKAGETKYLVYQTKKNGTPLVGCKSYIDDFGGTLTNLGIVLAINAAEAGIVVELSFDGNTYTANYNYYIIDYYDWNLNPQTVDELNIYGYADYYVNYGKYSNTISWDKDTSLDDIIF